MSWTESDHARLVALKQQRASMMRLEDGTPVPDEQLDKNKIRKLTIEIKEINKRLVAYQRGLEQGTVSEEEPAVEEPAVEEPAVEEPAVEEPAETTEKLTWPQFRSKHKGKPKEEISRLWAEYKESLN